MGSLLGESVATALLVVGLPLYNFFANRWPPFNGPLYVPMNLGLLGLVVAAAFGPLRLTIEGIVGSGHAAGSSFLIGLLLGAALTVPLFLLIPTRWGSRLVADERVGHLSDPALVYQVLVRIPLGTAAVEEVVFRGALFATWRPSGMVFAAVASSVVFGLWHVGPTINLVRANKPGASRADVVKAILGAVAFTTLAGVGLVWLRVELGLLAPIALHAAVNGLATVTSVLAYRRRSRDQLTSMSPRMP